ncbi:MAG: hypothetical protein A3G49_05545 [Candidatus Sungbacteria bacterium RIFCSPLOWO2_12_FULL_41_11]|uniref:Uncharacterized protein n=1 Tax=Candidatus Sungbacteria bacterium RIFCSPLOWO2_12_FULL_41_11 TaxID=1802286 RepID=A0A1G2LUP8_9BACT|nr:MAG: hypothetical protein UV01_C0008G0045 [Parcubacteria group bacterium GW2011_GWA2_42_14]OHA14619.1 MAG: hypothetical protein A3G49_05545 [Candidatus Sungbacteria bacterium RIFCSPLOWO2_12_FULL_41_11]
MADKQAKGAPKLTRAGKPKTKAKYANQAERTAYNKLRRIIRSNGDTAADMWASANKATAIFARVRREFAEAQKRRGLSA